MPRTLEKLDEMQGIQQTKMSIEQRTEMLLQQLDLYRLQGVGLEQTTHLLMPYLLIP